MSIITFAIIYFLFGVLSYSYGLYRLYIYKQKSKVQKLIPINFILFGLFWPLFVFMAIERLVKTGVYKNEEKI